MTEDRDEGIHEQFVIHETVCSGRYGWVHTGDGEGTVQVKV